MFEPVIVGWGLLAKIDAGTRFSMRRVRLAQDLWAPDYQSIRLHGRFILWKSVHQEMNTRFWDYRQMDEVSASAPLGPAPAPAHRSAP